MAKTLFRAGDLVWVNLDPTLGGEKSKTRPCMVLVDSGHPWGILIVVPVTAATGKRPPALFVPIAADASTGLKKPSLIDCYQIRCLAGQRLGAKLGKASPETLAEVRVRIAKILDIGEEHVR